MQTKPAGWPAEGSVETVPEVFLQLAGSSWPPARDGVPQGTAMVGEWSVDRQLTGSSLPGQVRGAAGFSIATGSVSFAQPDGAPLSPWGRGSLGIGPGGVCALYASHFGPSTLTGLKLGSFVVAPISGSNTSGTVNLQLDENSARLKKPFTLNWRYNMQVSSYAEPPHELDACWVLDQVARAGGYFQTPKPVASAFVSLPLVGGTMADRGTTLTATIAGWAAAGTAPGLGPGSTVAATVSTPAMPDSFYLTADVSGAGGRILIGTAVFDFGATALAVRAGITTLATANYPASTGTVKRVQAQITRQSPTAFQVRVRVSGGAWSGLVSASFPSAPWTKDTDRISVDTNLSPVGRWIRGVQLHTSDDTGVWAEPTAEIDISHSPLHAAFGIGRSLAWDVAQQIASATMGAAWISEAGVFTYRNGDRMRGTDAPVETIEALESLESLDWTMDPAEIADRVELTYTPTNVVASNGTSTLWEATEKIRVPARYTLTVYAEITGTTNKLAAFVPVWRPSSPDAVIYADGRMSRWAASTSPEGGGTQPAENALSVRAEMVGLSRARIRITNNTGTTLWLVDGTGSPCLILRSSLHITPGEPVTISHGPGEDAAVSPLSVDAGVWVQDPDAAQLMLDWLVGQTSSAKPVLNRVAVKPDLSRQLGDVIRLTDGHTELRTEAIITGISLAGGPDGYTQNLDLALLDVIFQDFDTWSAAQGINTFADLDAWFTANNITDFAQFDEWAINLGGTW